MDDGLTLEAPAKINLYLEVTGRRDDGYHELVTVLQTIDLCDTLTVQLRERSDAVPPGVPDVALESSGAEDCPAGADNLAHRAAAAVLRATGLADEAGVMIRLTKRIPAGGGLGGGSSDAAAAARATNELLGSPCDHRALSRLCAELGSDVPFFLTGGTALCTGRGERVLPVAPPAPFEATLVLPPFGVSTASVYAALGADPLPAPRRPIHDKADSGHEALLEALDGASVEELEAIYRNDLEQAALIVAPPLAELLKRPGLHLSGSGSTLFALGERSSGLLAGIAPRSIRFVRVRAKNR